MANVLGIETLMILTAVSKVAIHFGTSKEEYLDRVTIREVRAYQKAGHFPAGSMGPKIDAAIRFLEGGGERVIIGKIDEALQALNGESGTRIVPNDK
jgi:carbamate kinase